MLFNKNKQQEPPPTVGSLFSDWLAESGAEADASHADAVAAALHVLADNDDTDFTPLFEMLLRGARYETDVASAEEAGEIKGRNTRIGEMLESRNAGDGLPHLSAGTPPATRRSPNIFDLARSSRL